MYAWSGMSVVCVWPGKKKPTSKLPDYKIVNIELLDSRRLTGPNLFWGLPGAILDVAIEGASADRLISNWSKEVAGLMEAVGWPTEHICSRVFDGGVSLVINAPIDVLYAACELNEVAFNRALASLAGDPLPDLSDSLSTLSRLLADESKPALLNMQAAAAHHQVPFLWDDDEVSVGFGKQPLRGQLTVCLNRIVWTGQPSVQSRSASSPAPMENLPLSDCQQRFWPLPACAPE